MRMPLLPPHHDRFVRHQLVLELGGAAALLVASRQAILIAVVGAGVLPATHRTWVWWLRHAAPWPAIAGAVLVAALQGPAAVATVLVVGCATGMVRLMFAGSSPPPPGGDDPAPDGADQLGSGSTNR